MSAEFLPSMLGIKEKQKILAARADLDRDNLVYNYLQHLDRFFYMVLHLF